MPKKRNYQYTPRPDAECKHPIELRRFWAERMRKYYWKRKQKQKEEAK